MEKRTAAIVTLFFCLIVGFEICGCAGNNPVAPGYYHFAPTATTAFSPAPTATTTATPILILPMPTFTPILGI